jgi:hypothetical protein
MEVTAGNFTALLPWMLYQISCSSFVAIDFEFSGIAINPSSQAQKDQSLQERYKEVKAAAERYQILQIGLTICQENRANGPYTEGYTWALCCYLANKYRHIQDYALQYQPEPIRRPSIGHQP